MGWPRWYTAGARRPGGMACAESTRGTSAHRLVLPRPRLGDQEVVRSAVGVLAKGYAGALSGSVPGSESPVAALAAGEGCRAANCLPRLNDVDAPTQLVAKRVLVGERPLLVG